MRTSQESPVLIIGGLVALRLAWGFCCVWLERSRRKTTLAVMNALIAWERSVRSSNDVHASEALAAASS
jgi:hypothetical protein